MCSLTVKRTRTTPASSFANEEIELDRSCKKRQEAYNIEKFFEASYVRCSKNNSKDCSIYEAVKCFNETDAENQNGECHPG